MWLLAVLAIGLVGVIARCAAQDCRVFAQPHDSEHFARAQLQRRRRNDWSRSGYSLGVC